jgi:broad-specificity NMP kinase
MFCDGKKAYNPYFKHEKGMVILGPPGCGKSTFCRKQNCKNWVDQDPLFSKLGANWKTNYKNPNEFKLNYMRCDYLLEQSKQLGYRIIGSLFRVYVPDAIVIPPLKTYKEWIKNRKDLCFNK